MKAHCPGCGAGMKAKRRFCGECGQRNPLFPPKVSAVKAVRPVLVKSARPASIADIRYGQLLREIRQEPDPERREVFTGQLVALMKGNVA